MKWGKIVLIFQAVVTLVFGIIFFAQVLALDIAQVSELTVSANNSSEPDAAEPINIKQRYASAAYILLFVSLMELVIIIKLFT